MKNLFILLFASCVMGMNAQKIYHPKEDAAKMIKNAVNKAKKENKHVLIQAGGNWCGWCILFDKTVRETPALKKALQDNYVTYHLNYSKENTNKAAFKSLGFPQRFGFPVFIILDGDGNRIHTQNSVYLEKGKGYDTERVIDFLNHWSYKALNPDSYQ